MILEIDIGNSWAKWRVLDAPLDTNVVMGKTRSAEFPSEEILSLRNIRRVRLASVRSGAETTRISQAISSVLGVGVEVAETARCQAGLTNSYQDPSHMGVDRWLAMLAAFNRQETGTAKRGCLVVSCGTAVTLDSIRNDGVHEGGYILPGLFMMREALLSNTGRIQFTPGEFEVSRVLGRSTTEAVEHGAVHAVLSAIEHLCEERVKQWGSGDVFITGGDALQLSKQLRVSSAVSIQCVEDLVLEGLRFALP